MSIHRSVLMFVLITAGVVMAQQAGNTGLDPLAGNGVVRNNQYTNTYYNFSYKFPASWKVMRGPDAIAQEGGCAKDNCTLLMLQPEKGSGRIEIHAMPLAPGTTAKDVLQKAGAQEESYGMKPEGAASEFDSGGLKLQRLDYKSQVGDSEILETLMATSIKGDALLFTILTDSRGSLNDLVAGVASSGGVEAAQKDAAKGPGK